jgi:hypothetical protein
MFVLNMKNLSNEFIQTSLPGMPPVQSMLRENFSRKPREVADSEKSLFAEVKILSGAI